MQEVDEEESFRLWRNVSRTMENSSHCSLQTGKLKRNFRLENNQIRALLLTDTQLAWYGNQKTSERRRRCTFILSRRNSHFGEEKFLGVFSSILCVLFTNL